MVRVICDPGWNSLTMLRFSLSLNIRRKSCDVYATPREIPFIIMQISHYHDLGEQDKLTVPFFQSISSTTHIPYLPNTTTITPTPIP